MIKILVHSLLEQLLTHVSLLIEQTRNTIIFNLK